MTRVVRSSIASLAMCVLVASSFAWTRQAEGKRGVTAEDYLAFEFVSDPRVSPDGKLVAYVITTVDQKQNRRHSSIWMTTTDGGRGPWQFTTSPQNSNTPRWSPDGQSLAFISSRGSADGPASDARPQVWALSMSGARRGASQA